MSFTSKFTLVPLGDVARFINGDRSANYPKGDDYVDDGIPFISAADLDEGRVDYSCVRRISSNAYERLRNGKIQNDDILFCLRGSIGKLAYIKNREMGAIASSLVIVRATEKTDPRYLFFALSSQAGQQAAVGLNNGAAQPNLSVGELQKIAIPLPSVSTQRRIAGILSAYDELIENSQRRIQLLEDMARSLYREWFVHFRFPGHDGSSPSGRGKGEGAKPVPRLTSALGNIPQGWEVKPLSDVVEDIVDYRGKTPKKLNGDWSDEGILALSALNVKGGRLVSLEKSRCVNEDLYSRWMKNPLRRGDILMTSEAPLGELYYLCKQERYCLSQRLFSLRANSAVIAPVILYLCMESEQTQHELRSRASGATVSGIRQSELRKIPIVVPSRWLQDRVAPILQRLAEQKFTLDTQIQNLRRTRDLLLPRLLSGNMKLAVPESS